MRKFTAVPVVREEPLTFGADYLALDDAEAAAWKEMVQALHPRLLPQLKESALIEEEESEFCVLGGLFEYERGKELVIDGTNLRLSHCAEHFLDFLMPAEECLETVENKNVHEEGRARMSTLLSWWERGYRVLILQHG